MDAEDRMLAGRYRLLSPLGRGGMGTVWRARDEVLGRTVAIKEVRFPGDLDASGRAEATERARREARAAALLDHPAIVTVHDVVVRDDRPWIVMELIAGRSLEQVIRESGPLDVRRVASIGLAVLDALRAAHGRGVLHRDVKPANILLADDGRVVLTDFGIANLEGDSSLTRTGALVGSPGYIAPERLREERAAPGSDLWSLGATLYAAVEGVAPFARDTPIGSLGAVLTENAREPRLAGPLAPVLTQLLDKNPAARPDAAATERVLRQVAEGVATRSVAEPTISERVPSGRRRGVVASVAGAAIALVVGAVGVTFALADGRHPASHPSASPSPVATMGDFSYCDVLSPTRVSSLIPGSHRTKADPPACDWVNGSRYEELTLGPVDGTQATDSIDQARVDFIDEKIMQSQIGTAGIVLLGLDKPTFPKPKEIKARRTPVRPLTELGDEAFTYELNPVVPTDPAEAYMVIRYRNVVLKVDCIAPGSAAPDRIGLQAAQAALKALGGTG